MSGEAVGNANGLMSRGSMKMRTGFLWPNSRSLALMVMVLTLIWIAVTVHRGENVQYDDPNTAIKKYHEAVEQDMPDPDSIGFIPSCQRVVMYHDQKGNGLGAQVLRVLDSYLLARQLNATLLVARQMYWNYGCDMYLTWECYFEPVTPYCEGSDGELRRVDTMVSPEYCDAFREKTYKDKKCLLIADMTAEDELFKMIQRTTKPEEAFQILKERITDVWKPNLGIRQKTENALQRMNLEKNDFVGMHVRRGDKALEVPLVPLEEYAEAVRLSGSKSKKIFLATDDGSIIWELRDILPEYTIYTFANPEQRGHLQKRANEEESWKTVTTTLSLIAEIDILRLSSHYVGTYSSNIGRLVAILRSQPLDTVISMDVSWAPGVAWRSFGTDYCKSENDVHKGYCQWKMERTEAADTDGFYF